jgi:hypothetical protein
MGVIGALHQLAWVFEGEMGYARADHNAPRSALVGVGSVPLPSVYQLSRLAPLKEVISKRFDERAMR